MKDRQILFSAPMVRALLDGSKTQTRRVVKPQPEADQVLRTITGSSGLVYSMDETPMLPYPAVRRIRWDCLYGNPGDRIYGRETYYAWGRWETRFSAKKGRDEWHFVDMTLGSGREYLFAAGNKHYSTSLRANQGRGVYPGWWKRPALFMPKAAARIWLEITGVRVERLQGISEGDAMAEGVAPKWEPGCSGRLMEAFSGFSFRPAASAYADLWESINGAGSWDANPWVWVVEFKVVRGEEV